MNQTLKTVFSFFVCLERTVSHAPAKNLSLAYVRDKIYNQLVKTTIINIFQNGCHRAGRIVHSTLNKICKYINRLAYQRDKCCLKIECGNFYLQWKLTKILTSCEQDFVIFTN